MGAVLFPGIDQVDQMRHIFDRMGVPTEETWPGVTSLPNAFTLHVRTTEAPPPYAHMMPEALAAMTASCLVCCPCERACAREASGMLGEVVYPIPLEQ